LAQSPLDSFLNNNILKNANVSLCVKDIKKNEIVYQHNATNSITPASIMKLVTTATAIELLGANFSFKTNLEIDGKITEDSVLNGNLFIRGGGDPTLGSEFVGDPFFFKKWVAEIKKVGINKINGKIIADATLYDDEGVNPKWTQEDMGNYYAAGAYGIAFKDNMYRLVFRSGNVGTIPDILRTIPYIPELTFDNKVHSANIDYDGAFINGAPKSNSRTVFGRIPANTDSFNVKGDIPNPVLLLAHALNDSLVKAGVQISQSPSDKLLNSAPRKLIYTHLSPPLSQIIKVANVKSNNHYTEQVFRYLALTKDQIASSATAAEVVRTFWKSKGLDVDQLFMCDGSGLSPVDAVSSQFFVDILTYMKTKSANSDAFFSSLPIAGVSGTVSSLLKNTPLQGKVHVKSGTISRVKCYAGYIALEDKNYAFAMMVNNANGKTKEVVKKMEEFLLSITKP